MSSGSDSDSDPDATSSFEGLARYRRGTFYPARVGECVQSWRIQTKLGFGRLSTVWACVDRAEPAAHEPTHAHGVDKVEVLRVGLADQQILRPQHARLAHPLHKQTNEQQTVRCAQTY